MDPRDNILDSARRTFARHGYRHTSMAMVADEAQLSRQALYHHFDSKEALFAALVERLQVDALAAAEAARDGAASLPLAQALHATLHAHHRSLTHSVQGSPFAPELVEESMKHCADIVSTHARKVDALLKHLVRDAVKRGIFALAPGMTADELVGLILVGAKGIKMAHAQGPAKAHAQALKRMIDVLCAGAGTTATITSHKRIAR